VTLLVEFGEESAKVEGACVHGHAFRVVGRSWPVGLRAIAVELDAVLIGVSEVEGFADPVIGGAVQAYAGRDQPVQRIGERRARRETNGDVVEARRPGRRRRPAFRLPRVQPQVPAEMNAA